jgi:hypothetical protein
MYTGDPDDFPALLGVELQGVYTLPGLAGERAHLHFVGTDDWEMAWFVMSMFHAGAQVFVPASECFDISYIELSTQ